MKSLKVRSLMSLIGFLVIPDLWAAGKINIDARMDGQSQAYDDEAKRDGLGQSNFRYLLKTARLDFSQSLNEQTEFRSRLVLNTNQGNVNKRDSLNNTVDLFYLKYKFTDSLSLTGGKFASDMGGWENQYASPDVYHFTAVNSGVSTDLNTHTKANYLAQYRKSLLGGWSWAGSGIVKYYTGAKVQYVYEKHELALHSSNLTDDDAVGNLPSQNRTLVGAVYKGQYLEDKLAVILSHHQASLVSPPSGSLEGTAKYSALGLKLKTHCGTWDLDMLGNTFVNKSLLLGGAVVDDTVMSESLSWSNKWQNYGAKVKVESSQLTAGGEPIYDILAESLALEWTPKVEDNFRFHTAFINRDYSPVYGKAFNVQEILVGMRINASFL